MSATYDTDFAHAVRLAASGLRTASGIDPEAEAAPLAAILRSDRALEVDGLELLARLVTGDLRKARARAGETILAHAVRRAGVAWRKGKDVDPATTGARLAAVLRDGSARLGPGERNLLADLVTGELRKGTSRPGKGAGHQDVTEAVEAFRKRMASGQPRKVALIDTAAEFGITDRTIEKYVAMVTEREKIVSDVLAKHRGTTDN